jgi:hypothetical protein
MRAVRKFFRVLFYLKRRERLPLIPRHYASEFDHRVNHDIERVFERTAARDPLAVDVLLRRHNSSNVDQLLLNLSIRRRRSRPAKRFSEWVNRLQGTTPYEPVVKPFVKRLIRQKVIDRRDRLIRRTRPPI